MKRRVFLQTMGSVAGTSALALSGEATPSSTAPTNEPSLPRRVLGRTGEKISLIGFPGLCLIHGEQPECTEAIHRAYASGVNYFDVAPAYGNGKAETRMGIGLEGIDRKSIFLACKTKMRDAQGAREELERSLQLLKTDHFDLYQLHALIQPAEVEQALAPGGAIETLQKAKEEGKVRFLGFSAHTNKAAIKALTGFDFDTVMFPINFIEYFVLGFGKQVLDLAQQRGAAVLAIKPMCRGALPQGMENKRRWWYRPMEDESEIDLGLRFTLSQTPVVAGLPPAFFDLVDKAIAAGRQYRPITAEETEKLRALAQTCESVFRREESKVAFESPHGHEPSYPDSPHESCPFALG
jgi:predicted aldo/keto reductase-like oxidoreductase